MVLDTSKSVCFQSWSCTSFWWYNYILCQIWHVEINDTVITAVLTNIHHYQIYRIQKI